MKIQDIGFFLILIIIVWKRNSTSAVILGLFSLLIAVPLFEEKIFFTAERLTWYAAGFFLLAIIVILYTLIRDKKN